MQRGNAASILGAVQESRGFEELFHVLKEVSNLKGPNGDPDCQLSRSSSGFPISPSLGFPSASQAN